MRSRAQRWIGLAVVAGAAASIAGGVVLRRHETRVIGAHFGGNLQIWADSFRNALELSLEVLYSLRVAGEDEKGIEEREFRRIAAPAIARHAEFCAFEWAPRVPGAGRAAVEARARAAGQDGFVFTERAGEHGVRVAGDRREYVPVLHVEPTAGNELALGFDLAADGLRRAALDEAKDSGAMRAAGPVRLFRAEGAVVGLLFVLPVYDGVARTVDERRAALRGFVVAACRGADLIAEAIRREPIDIELAEFSLFATGAPSDRAEIFSRHDANGKSAVAIGARSASIEVAGSRFSLRATPTEEYVASRRSSRPFVATLAGLALTLLGGCTLTALRLRTRAIERLVESRTADLEKQKSVLQSVLDNLGDGVAVADERGRLTLFNPAAESILGLGRIDSGPEEWSRLYGLYQLDRTTPIEAADLPLAQAVTGRECRDVEIFVRNPQREGGVFIRVTATPLLDRQGNVRGGVAVFRDITERRYSEYALRDSEERFRAIVAATGSALVILAPDHRIIEFNPEAERIYGMSRARALDRNFLELFLPREYRAIVAADIDKALKGRATLDLEIPIRSGTSDNRILLLSISRLTKVDGGVLGAVATGHDITERREAEEAQRVRQLAAHLQSAREGERKHAAREIHDELGQVLTGLKFEFSHLARKLATVQPELHDTVSGLERLIDQTIGSVRRIAAELRPQILDKLGLLEAIRWQAREFEQRTGIVCSLELPEENITWSPERSTAVFRIFQESLTNVARHSGAAHVGVRIDRDAGQVVLEIRDDGRGIRDDELANAHSFGLMGMRERARMFGGALSVRGLAGDGTVVRARIPL